MTSDIINLLEEEISITYRRLSVNVLDDRMAKRYQIWYGDGEITELYAKPTDAVLRFFELKREKYGG